MSKFTHHIFVCLNERPKGDPRGCCAALGSVGLHAFFKKEVERLGLKGIVRANKAGCLDQCELGPTIVIYPQGIWYGRVRREDVDRIVEQTVVNGQIIEELLIPDDQLNTKGGRPSSDASSTGESVDPPP